VDEYYSLGYRDELEHFVDCVRDGREQAAGTTAADGLEVLRTIRTVYEANQSGKMIHPKR
jgi:predicted dehydrogenase